MRKKQEKFGYLDAGDKRFEEQVKSFEERAEEAELFLGLDPSRLTPEQRAKIIQQYKASRAFEDGPDGRRLQSLENQRIEVIAEIEEVVSLPANVVDKHRRLATLNKELDRIHREIHASEAPGERRTRLSARVGELRAAGNKKFLKEVASEEGISVTRLKQLIRRSKRKLKER